MKSYTISIIIPVYNREETLNRCIDSILKSKHKDIEIIIVDDGSTDESWNIIQSYTDNRIKSIHIENSGVTVARNVGLKVAKGDYIHFVDSDDFLDLDIYTILRNVITDELPDMIMFDYNVYFESDKSKHPKKLISLPKHELLNQSYIRNNILPVMVNIDGRRDLFIETFVWNKLFKRIIIEENNITFDEDRLRWEDRLFQVVFLKYASTFYYEPMYGYNYVNGHSYFSSNYDKSVFEIILNGNSDYRKIVGDLYDFDTPYARNYYCNVLISTILQQFSLKDIDKKDLKKDIYDVLIDSRTNLLFDEYDPTTRFERNIKESIIRKDQQKAFYLFIYEYYKQDIKQKIRISKLYYIIKKFKSLK